METEPRDTHGFRLRFARPCPVACRQGVALLDCEICSGRRPASEEAAGASVRVKGSASERPREQVDEEQHQAQHCQDDEAGAGEILVPTTVDDIDRIVLDLQSFR